MAYQVEDFAGEVRTPPVRTNDSDSGGGHWMLGLVASLSARVMLRRLLRRRPVNDIGELPPHLLRDIGLPQELHHGGLARLHPPV